MSSLITKVKVKQIEGLLEKGTRVDGQRLTRYPRN